MNAVYALLAVVLLVLLVFLGVGVAGAGYLFGVILPYAAIAIFIVGFVACVVKWGKSAVPFRIPTTCGQQKTLPWFKYSKLENPSNNLEVVGRMALEVLFFRSLFRNTKAELLKGPRLVYGGTKYLWAAALAFHWCFLVILFRHMRFFTEPVPWVVNAVAGLDGLFQVALPVIYITDAVILGALTYLFLRRVFDTKIRYLSLASDYFALFLLLGIVLSGMLMRYFEKVDIVGIKEMALGLVTFKPVVPEGVGLTFYTHLFLVVVFLAYFPFSKLMHMPGVFLSPTRNLANNNRSRRHINPWNPKVKVHTYEEWEDEFREKMKACGLPLEKE